MDLPFFRYALRFSGIALCALLAGPLMRAQDGTLRVSYAGKTVTFTSAVIAALPHQEISALDAHDKSTHRYAGVPVRDVLAQVGVPFGEKLRGPALRLILIARARDNYEVAYALAEFDDAFNDRTILLVDRQDGAPLGPASGPFRLLVPGDKRPARWARMIVALQVIPVGEGR